MKAGTGHRDLALPVPRQTAKISQPDTCPLDLPAALIALQFVSVLLWCLRASLAMRTAQINSTFGQAFAQRSSSASPVVNKRKPLRILCCLRWGMRALSSGLSACCQASCEGGTMTAWSLRNTPLGRCAPDHSNAGHVSPASLARALCPRQDHC
jgi:hypothetical protein